MVQEKCGFKYQWTTDNVDVPLMHETRKGHVSSLTKEEWIILWLTTIPYGAHKMKWWNSESKAKLIWALPSRDRTRQSQIRTVVNAVLGECIWNLSYNERRMAIELELTITLDDDAIGNLCCQFPITADYDGIGARGSKFAFYFWIFDHQRYFFHVKLNW